MFQGVLHGLLDLVWPPRTQCLLCQGALTGGPGPVCQPCWSSMPFREGLRLCATCARPLIGRGDRCTECAAEPAFGRVWALGLHAQALREAIHFLKFNQREELGIPLGRLLGARIQGEYACILPVPLHRSRLRERGYNQAALIARGVGIALRAPVLEHGLQRRRATGHQAKLDRAERLQNLVGAFGVQGEKVPWAGQPVLLVDDVLTTGATAAAAAGVLRASGAAQVDLAVLAVSTTPMNGAGHNELSINERSQGVNKP